jgi:hypothetical protein
MEKKKEERIFNFMFKIKLFSGIRLDKKRESI